MFFNFLEIDEEVANIGFASKSETNLYGINRNYRSPMISADGGYTWATVDDATYTAAKADGSMVRAKTLPFEDWDGSKPDDLAPSYGLTHGSTKFSGEFGWRVFYFLKPEWYI